MHRAFLIFMATLAFHAQAQTAAISPTTTPNPWQVKGVSVILSGTTGFTRDVALEQAARQALPQILQNPLGLTPAEATKKARAVGEAMRFVARYQIVQEAVLPTYSLKADLTFNESMLRKNFGGMIGPVLANTSASLATNPALPAAPSVNRQGYIVRVPEASAAGQDRARRALAALPETIVTYRLISVQGIELNVRSTQSESVLRAALAGWQAEVRPAQAEAVIAAVPELEAQSTTPATPKPPTAPVSRRPAWLPDLW